MELHKIRFRNDGTTISYTDNTNSKITLDTDELPLDNFKKAIDDMTPIMAKICEIENKDLQATGITLSAKQKKEYICITGRKTVSLSNSPFNIASPLVNSHEANEIIGFPLIDNIEYIKEKAKDFIDGERRKQEKLFKEPKKKRGKKDGSQEIE